MILLILAIESELAGLLEPEPHFHLHYRFVEEEPESPDQQVWGHIS